MISVLLQPSNLYQIEYLNHDDLKNITVDMTNLLTINFISYIDGYRNFFKLMKKTREYYITIVDKLIIDNYKISYKDLRELMSINRSKNIMKYIGKPADEKLYDTSLILSFGYNINSALGLPFDFLINGEIM